MKMAVKTRQYVAVIESTFSAAGEVVARCEAINRAQAERKMDAGEGTPREVMTAREASRLGCHDPRGLVR